jgi:hypothetical protein
MTTSTFPAVARFVTRLQGEGDGLFIGVLMTGGLEHFKPNTIYEIREVLGTLQIVEVGQACGAGSDNCVSDKMSEHMTPFHWAQDIGNIIACQGKYMFLTLEEYRDVVARQNARFK